MTVPTSVGGTRYTGDGATSTYSVGFYFQAAADLLVSVTTTSDVNTELTLNTHYTVSGAGDQSGGTITLLSPHNNLTTGYILAIQLRPALNNSTSFTDSGRVSNAQIQALADRMSQRDIRQQDELDRCIKLPKWEAGTEAKTNIGDAAARASKYLGFDSSGNPTLTSSVSEGSLNVSAFGETLLDDTTASDAQSTLGISTFVKTILDDANAAAVRTTIGIDGASGNIASGDIAANAVVTAKIADANVTGVKLASSAIAQLFQARLTLTSATAVTTSDVTSAGTIYLTPYKGNKIAIYSGSIWKLYELTEISLALTATSGKNYDVWVYDNSGTPTLETTEWTNDTTRATALALQDGVYCKTGALTRRYVGTFRASGSNVTEDSMAKRFVWNMYNRVVKFMEGTDTTIGGWSYTNATVRQANDSTANQLDFVRGVNEDAVEASLLVVSRNSSANIQRVAGIAQDSTTTVLAASLRTAGYQVIATGNNLNSLAASEPYYHICIVKGFPTAGRHYLSWNEASVASGTTTWEAEDGAAAAAAGLLGSLLC